MTGYVFPPLPETAQSAELVARARAEIEAARDALNGAQGRKAETLRHELKALKVWYRTLVRKQSELLDLERAWLDHRFQHRVFIFDNSHSNYS